MHIKDINLLYNIQGFFNTGTVTQRVRNGKPSAIYSVQSIKILSHIIIPHFKKYCLLTEKKIDFLLFSDAVEIMYNTASLELCHINKILSLKSCMGKDKGLSNILLNLFPNVDKLVRSSIVLPDYLKQAKINSLWLAGFTSAEGMFYIKPVNYKGVLRNFIFVFSITQHARDSDLFHKIKDFLGCGTIETKSTRINEVVYCVYKYSDILEKILPFFLNYEIVGIKHNDFLDFHKAILLSENKKSDENFSIEELNSAIALIKSGMNSKRK